MDNIGDDVTARARQIADDIRSLLNLLNEHAKTNPPPPGAEEFMAWMEKARAGFDVIGSGIAVIPTQGSA